LSAFEVDAARHGFGHSLDVSIPVADLGLPDRLERRGGEFLCSRRGAVNAPVRDEGLPEGASQIGPHRVCAPEGGVLEEDDVDDCVEHRVGALGFRAEVVVDARGEDGVALCQRIEGPEIVVHAQVRRHPLASLVDLGRGQRLTGEDRQLEAGRFHRPPRDDIDLHEVSR
jgi:hypothetical protein